MGYTSKDIECPYGTIHYMTKSFGHGTGPEQEHRSICGVTCQILNSKVNAEKCLTCDTRKIWKEFGCKVEVIVEQKNLSSFTQSDPIHTNHKQLRYCPLDGRRTYFNSCVTRRKNKEC